MDQVVGCYQYLHLRFQYLPPRDLDPHLPHLHQELLQGFPLVLNQEHLQVPRKVHRVFLILLPTQGNA